MHARLTAIDTAGTPAQLGAAVDATELSFAPAATVSAGALRIGLGHFIHEFNGPLQRVYWAAEMVMRIAKSPVRGDPFAGKMVEELKSGLDRLVSVVSSLHADLERLWQIIPALTSVDVDLLLRKIIQSDAAGFAAHGVRVDTEIAANLPALLADEKLLTQVFVNLFRNAVEAMPEGGLLSIRGGARAASLWFEIADTGSGIAAGLDVFQPFATSKPGGMGLGLAIVRHIMAIHGGTITCRSEPGKGTTFRLKFPRRFEAKTIPVRCAAAAADIAERLFGGLGHAPGGIGGARRRAGRRY